MTNDDAMIGPDDTEIASMSRASLVAFAIRMRNGHRDIVRVDRVERRTIEDYDPAGSTYSVTMVDGNAARLARSSVVPPEGTRAIAEATAGGMPSREVLRAATVRDGEPMDVEVGTILRRDPDLLEAARLARVAIVGVQEHSNAMARFELDVHDSVVAARAALDRILHPEVPEEPSVGLTGR